jgi:uncharacterized protein YndB with AHSA1/START domain
MPDIVQEVTIEVAPENVFHAITTPDGITGWWANQVTAEPKAGSLTEIRFDNGEVMQMEVAKCEVGEQLHWVVRHAPQPEWEGTRITWDLAPASKGTKLLFGHRGFPPSDTGYEQTAAGWQYFLHSLKSYLETGKGTPYVY